MGEVLRQHGGLQNRKPGFDSLHLCQDRTDRPHVLDSDIRRGTKTGRDSRTIRLLGGSRVLNLYRNRSGHYDD